VNNSMKAVMIGLIGAIGATPAARAADVPPAEASSLSEAITGGKLLLNLRPRYEHVEQENKPKDADAYTMRTLIGWRTLPWNGLGLTLEGINVGHLGNKHYAPRPNVPSPYPLVADPDDTDVNQLYLDYTGLPKTAVRVGRQSIKLDNVRFIGNVEFRQVMQVFNAAVVENTSLPNTRLYAGYLWRQKTIFTTERNIDAPIFNARYTWQPGNDLIGYAYLIDQRDTGQATGFRDNSHADFGVRATGAYPITDKWKLQYTAEYAKQNDYADGDSRIDADYWHLAAGPQFGDWYVRLEHEILSSNKGRYGFQTPLGTNHLFQGWADQFLTTPRQGIRDTYISAGGKIGKLAIYGEVHKFDSDVRDIDFGHEFDVAVSYPLYKGLIGRIEFADYNAGDKVPGDALANKVDVRKFWVTLIYQY